MLHLGPGASRKRVLPSPDVLSGNTLGRITRRSHKSPTACGSRGSTKLGSLSLASSGHLHAPRPGGRRFPPPRFRSASPPSASPSTPRRKDAPRPGLRHHVGASYLASGPQEPSSQRAGNFASVTYSRVMIKRQAFCQCLFSTWFCGRCSVFHHEPQFKVVGKLAEFYRKADFLPYRFTYG